MSFQVAADSYDRFMGRYSGPLAPKFADFAGVGPDQQVLDVGCGPGALTGELVRRLGVEAVSAVDPSETFVTAVRERHPGVEVQQATAEKLPHPDGEFDCVLAQLVVHFMKDPVAGLAEMSRATRRNGVVAACVWDHAGGRGPLSAFFEAAQRFDPEFDDESGRAGTRQGHLAELAEAAGVRQIRETSLSVGVEHATFEEWWQPYTLGVGPVGAYVTGLDPDRRAELERVCRRSLPTAPFTITASVWAVRGLA
jgi:SAM-dependent methyltransferase